MLERVLVKKTLRGVAKSRVGRVSATSRRGRGPRYAPPALSSRRERGSCRTRDRQVRCVSKRAIGGGPRKAGRCLLLARRIRRLGRPAGPVIGLLRRRPRRHPLAPQLRRRRQRRHRGAATRARPCRSDRARAIQTPPCPSQVTCAGQGVSAGSRVRSSPTGRRTPRARS